jgi:hypothetical protein
MPSPKERFETEEMNLDASFEEGHVDHRASRRAICGVRWLRAPVALTDGRPRHDVGPGTVEYSE